MNLSLATVQQTAKLITCYLTSIFEITFELTGDDIYYVRNGEVQSRHHTFSNQDNGHYIKRVLPGPVDQSCPNN